MKVLDVRKPGEWEAESVTGAQNVPLDFINDNMSEIKKEETYYMHCRSGYRSTIAASILKARGYENLVNIHGAFDDIASTSIPTSDYTCPSKAK
jgi:rhodanese-related sulfurtransferase